MSVPDTPAPLPRPLLGRLGDRPDRDATDPDLLARDLTVLRDSGYLKLAVPVSQGGAGFNLRQVACAQRQLAARAPAAALAVTAHHAWAGAAADTLASGDPDDAAANWVLREAARGRFFAGHPGQLRRTGQPNGAGHPGQLRRTGQPDGAGHGGSAQVGADRRGTRPGRAEPAVRPMRGQCGLDELEALAADPPSWDWLAVQAPDGRKGNRPEMVHTFAGRDGLGGGPTGALALRTLGEPLVAGMFGWALPLTGMAWYAVARQAFELAVGRTGQQAEGELRAGHLGSAAAGHPLDRWEVAEAALRLDSLRGQLDEAIDGWERRAMAGGALTSLDPGGQWLIRLFTVRHAAADGARRVIELAAEIAGKRTGLANLTRPVGPVGPVGPVRA
jgi:alkylation response protein AidB-like acyl-CoA dehydrogenase